MTLEEAIKLLKQYQGYDPMFPDGETLKHAFDLTDETVDTLLAALRPVSRETVERMRGKWIKPHWKTNTSCAVCSQCGFEAHHHEYHGVQDTYLFCPRCMAPMTDEAVEMVMERLEALKNGKGD